jgi:hypothetical protein
MDARDGHGCGRRMAPHPLFDEKVGRQSADDRIMFQKKVKESRNPTFI